MTFVVMLFDKSTNTAKYTKVINSTLDVYELALELLSPYISQFDLITKTTDSVTKTVYSIRKPGDQIHNMEVRIEIITSR